MRPGRDVVHDLFVEADPAFRARNGWQQPVIIPFSPPESPSIQGKSYTRYEPQVQPV